MGEEKIKGRVSHNCHRVLYLRKKCAVTDCLKYGLVKNGGQN